MKNGMEDFEEIVRQHQRRIYRIFVSLLHNPDEADMLTQECFLRAYSRRNGFRGDARPGTWLLRIAVNLARDHLKSRRQGFWRRLLRGRESEAQSVRDVRRTPEDTILDGERVAAIWIAVEDLPVRQRTVFTLRFAEEMSLGEIANAMNVQEGTVKAQLASAVHAVQRRLKQDPTPRLRASA